MCAGASVHVRFQRVVFGAPDAKGGAAGGAMNILQFPTLNHRCEVSPGVREPECRHILRSFFQVQRARRTEDSPRVSDGESPPADSPKPTDPSVN